MPKSGYTSLTLPVIVYDHFSKLYAANRDKLAYQGITSLSGWLTSILENVMESDSHYQVVTLVFPKGGKKKK